MTDEPEAETVDRLILDHLDTADLPETAKDLIIGALLGREDFDTVLGGTAAQRPQPPTPNAEPPEPIGTYLASIGVTGFRGIGRTATLDLIPGPGLTIVAGRNGSGKSSFAEAAELALTGDNKRWSGRSAVWQQGWRNLHAAGETRIRIRLGVEGQRNGAIVECRWADGATLDNRTTFLQPTGERRQPVTALGWARPLELYRPFLSYSELGALLSGKPSEIHDSLQRILGLGRLVEIEKMLKDARHDMDQRRKAAAAGLPALKELLAGHPDPRAHLAEQVFAAPNPDLDQLDTLTTGDEAAADVLAVPLRQLDVLALPNRDEIATEVDRLRAALREIDDLAGTPVEGARVVAGLLRQAIAHHAGYPDQPCPVCGGRTLDQPWATEARTRLRDLDRLAERLDAAHRAERDARRTLRERVPVAPSALSVDLAVEGVATDEARTAWQRWDDLLTQAAPGTIAGSAFDVFDVLLTTLAPMQAAAREALERRRQAWRPAADALRAWIETERSSRHAATMYTMLRKAIGELQTIGKKVRSDKLAPVAAAATRIWNELRQDSNVQLGAIRLAGTGTSRRVDVDVQVDDAPGAALSVMSQGELHSLALALFLPRATMPASPFRFLVIDDPVQSMDPAKVYGLARVLAEVAKHRQVIVFTHDDRLPAAARHLQLPARIVAISRLARSVVNVSDNDGDPARRYLTDAYAITQDENMAPTVQSTIVCNLIRDAIEYVCHENVRIRGFRTGTSIADIEAAIGETQGLRATLALALLGDRKRIGELGDALRSLHPAAGYVVKAANTGSHGAGVRLPTLVDDARRVIEKLAAS